MYDTNLPMHGKGKSLTKNIGIGGTYHDKSLKYNIMSFSLCKGAKSDDIKDSLCRNFINALADKRLFEDDCRLRDAIWVDCGEN